MGLHSRKPISLLSSVHVSNAYPTRNILALYRRAEVRLFRYLKTLCFSLWPLCLCGKRLCFLFFLSVLRVSAVNRSVISWRTWRLGGSNRLCLSSALLRISAVQTLSLSFPLKALCFSLWPLCLCGTTPLLSLLPQRSPRLSGKRLCLAFALKALCFSLWPLCLCGKNLRLSSAVHYRIAIRHAYASAGALA